MSSHDCCHCFPSKTFVSLCNIFSADVCLALQALVFFFCLLVSSRDLTGAPPCQCKNAWTAKAAVRHSAGYLWCLCIKSSLYFFFYSSVHLKKKNSAVIFFLSCFASLCRSEHKRVAHVQPSKEGGLLLAASNYHKLSTCT